MGLQKKIEERYERRVRRTRAKLHGTPERPRLSVFRSAQHIYAQVIDDEAGTTLATSSTLSKEMLGSIAESNKTDAAKKIGEAIAKVCLDKGIKKVVFDRGGFQYHGRISALADAARAAGLEF
ncbi:MAG: 50S ribosomal protein L18 [Deltaproteobacteria bacterium]|nr:50S ribosomal protein L18 [Deltaproteobacteria bacterium]